MEIGVDIYIKTGDKKKIVSAFERAHERDFKDEIFRLYFQTLKTALLPENQRSLDELINDVISGKKYGFALPNPEIDFSPKFLPPTPF